MLLWEYCDDYRHVPLRQSSAHRHRRCRKNSRLALGQYCTWALIFITSIDPNTDSTHLPTRHHTVNVPLNFDDRPPAITVDTAAINAAACFTSQAAVEASIPEKTTVTDNCTPANLIVKTIVHFEENCAFTRTVMETVDLCGNKATGKILRCVLHGVR